MAVLDSGGQRSRSQQAVEVAKASGQTPVEVRLLVVNCGLVNPGWINKEVGCVTKPLSTCLWS